ncbi:hypothetical protein Avbf_13911 [Armadillidium vulgare]|nr:hypothetical protein Avbf_13911 [Armadillidium vulgare]
MVLKNLSIISHIRVQSQRPDVFSIIDQGYPHPRVRCYRDYNISISINISFPLIDESLSHIISLVLR